LLASDDEPIRNKNGSGLAHRRFYCARAALSIVARGGIHASRFCHPKVSAYILHEPEGVSARSR
jgi:hypothetical protein